MNVTTDNYRYGLFGHPLGHSLSSWLHLRLMAAAGLDYSYDLIDLPPQDFSKQIPLLLNRYRGLNCTIPYKEQVIAALDSLDAGAANLRSVNTIFKSRGYNTDREGFLSSGPTLYGRKVLILGAGGVSRMLAFASVDEQAATIKVMSRRREQAKLLVKDIINLHPGCKIEQIDDIDQLKGKNWVVLQGTPAGMWPHTQALPLPEAKIQQLLNQTTELFDTIYNPVATRLVLMARTLGIKAKGGLEMLFGQALAAQKIWHPQVVFKQDDLGVILQEMAAAVYAHSPVSVILTGFMGSGKSTVGKILSSLTKLPFFDLDEIIAQETGQEITRIFADRGERKFRELEHQCLQVCLQSKHSQVLATGGGTLTLEQNRKLVAQNAALVIYLDCSLPEIRKRVGYGQGRPLWQGQQSQKMQNLYDKRLNFYKTIADRIISAEQSPEKIAALLAFELGFGGKLK